MMQPTLTLRYVPETDDLVELLMIHAPALRRVRRRVLGQAVAVLVILWAMVLWLAATGRAWQWWIPVLLLAVVLVNDVVRAFARTTRWSLRRKARAAPRRSPRMRLPHEAEIAPEALTIRSEGRTIAFAWSQFGSFTESDRQFVLLDQRGRATALLPKRGLSGTELVPVCRDLLTGYITDASARPDA
ncbi:YcxB family protein [Streptomyces sp. NPDC048278]|uniref:YcxB family protein n=1 Tax=unclassified Streptomyces TaxID=2593676 RepID=UPI003420E5F4